MNSSSPAVPDADGRSRTQELPLAAFYDAAGRLLPWFALAALMLALLGVTVGLRVSTEQLHQGHSDRILFIHLPAVAMALLLFLLMAAGAALGVVLQSRAASIAASALAPTGALMAFVALWTGALWGKPTWGSWWVWDPRLTAMLVLLAVFVAAIAAQQFYEDAQRADRALALAALVGVVVLLAGALLTRAGVGRPVAAPTGAALLPAGMLAGMAIMALALLMYCAASALARLRSIILERERDAAWVETVLPGPA